jgi:hypothetical protein
MFRQEYNCEFLWGEASLFGETESRSASPRKSRRYGDRRSSQALWFERPKTTCYIEDSW